MILPGRPLQPFCAPGSALSPWTLLTSTDQASNAIFDPGSVTDTGTGFNSTTGLFTWVMKGDTTRIDGYNEQSARWTKRIVDLYPDFDPTLDLIDLCLVDPVIPLLTGAEKYGIQFGILDSAAGVAGAGSTAGFYPQTAAAMQEVLFGASAASATGSFTGNAIQRALMNFPVRPDGARVGVRWWYRLAGVWAEGSTGSTSPTISATAANWRIHIGHVHVSTTSATPTMTATLYHRRTRTTGLTGIA